VPLNGAPEKRLLQKTGSQDQGFAPFRLVSSDFKPWSGAGKSKPAENGSGGHGFAHGGH